MKEETKWHKEGYEAYERGEYVVDNPYIGDDRGKGWQWSFGWHDAMANKVAALDLIINTYNNLSYDDQTPEDWEDFRESIKDFHKWHHTARADRKKNSHES